MNHIKVGEATVRRVEERHLSVSLRMFTEDSAVLAEMLQGLPAGFGDMETMEFQFSNHSWIVEADGLRVLVDPCTGNGRKGRGPHFDDLDLPYLDNLGATGPSPADVDVVFSTHLHHDHCGWNTMEVDGRWVPTFPNASYLLPRAEYDRWDTSSGEDHPNHFNPNVFDECVRPLVDVGLLMLIEPSYRLSPSLTIEAAAGHTEGHAMLRLESGGRSAYFTGDAFHHPMQLIHPEWHLPGCDDLSAAIATREMLVARALEEEALLFPAHFPAPHFGHLVRDAARPRFVPGESRS